MNFQFYDREGGDAWGACAVNMRRARDRRFWIVCPYGDTAADEGAGLWPAVRCVTDDFGNLQRAGAF